jgi:iron-sulfur cluster assembly 1
VYSLKYIDPAAIGKFDEVIPVRTDGSIRVVVDAKAVMSLIGSRMDWKEDLLEKGFTFANPNVTEECGCGLSFSVSSRS